ncbi:MAG: SAM-dependent methyltransferase [Kyrpidia sp.]|nr:SAM-dependent methyltransferase [Kyrpidia sp.]
MNGRDGRPPVREGAAAAPPVHAAPWVPLKDRLAEHIRRNGPMTAREFMQWALYDPADGYYMKEHAVFGRGGDYYTAPDIHPVYGRTLAGWMTERTRELGWPDVHVVEFGAGTGRLAAQILESWQRLDPGPLRYSIVELSPAWRRHQAVELAPWGSAVAWPEEMPVVDRAVVIAHELLDAMPVHLLRRTARGLEEAWVDLSPEGRLIRRYARASSEGRSACEQWRPAVPQDCGFEVAPGVTDWVRTVLERVREGIILVVDYGDDEERLYGPHHPHGTLRAFFRHRCLDAWWDEPGERDITADVNFTAVRRAAREAGGETAFDGSLGEFLWAAGIARELSDCPVDRPFDPRARQNRAVKHLLLPGGLGGAFRVLEIDKGVDARC